MGVDTRIYLLNDVRLKDLANVMGVLSGLDKAKKSFESSRSDAWYLEVKNAKIESCQAVPECANITIEGSPLYGGSFQELYHYEVEDSRYRTILVRSTPFWIAMSVALVKFFGGKVDFNDSDEKDWDIKYPKPRLRNNPSDGQEWQDFEQAMYDVQSLTKQDVQLTKHYAAYD